jgi:hypothetical protein
MEWIIRESLACSPNPTIALLLLWHKIGHGTDRPKQKPKNPGEINE